MQQEARTQRYMRIATRKALSTALLVAGLATAACAAESDDPDLILTGGLIYPLGADDQPVEALAIRGERILALGTDGEITALAGDYTQQMNLEETAILPGSYDAWVDLEALGRWGVGTLDMRLASSIEEVQAMVRNAAGTSDTDAGWLVGWGWDENDWPTPELPTSEDLEAVGVERPVALLHGNGRAAWLNGAALQALSPQLEGLDGVSRGENGAPSGILVGAALSALDPVLAGSEEQRPEWLAEGARRAAAAGITRVATAPIDLAGVDILLELERRGLLPLRVDARLTPTAAGALDGGEALPRLADSHLVRVVAVGARLDGPLASRLAQLAEPYAEPGPSLPQLDTNLLSTAADAARSASLPLHVQASGDAAVALAIEGTAPDAVIVGADLLPEPLPAGLAERQIAIAPARFARDIYWLDRFLGPQRAGRAHAWSSLFAAGAISSLASDAPAYPLQPLGAVATAMTRQDAEGYPASGWHLDEGLPRGVLLRALSGPGGALAAGGPADLVAWSEDPVAGDAEALRRANALLTIVDGRVTFSRALVDLPMERAAGR